MRYHSLRWTQAQNSRPISFYGVLVFIQRSPIKIQSLETPMSIWAGCLSQGGGAHICRAETNLVKYAVSIGQEVGLSFTCGDPLFMRYGYPSRRKVIRI
jgi:hypothetical protein